MAFVTGGLLGYETSSRRCTGRATRSRHRESADRVDARCQLPLDPARSAQAQDAWRFELRTTVTVGITDGNNDTRSSFPGRGKPTSDVIRHKSVLSADEPVAPLRDGNQRHECRSSATSCPARLAANRRTARTRGRTTCAELRSRCAGLHGGPRLLNELPEYGRGPKRGEFRTRAELR